MEVTKVDFSTEKLDVDEGRQVLLYELFYPHSRAMTLIDGSDNDAMHARVLGKQVVYRIHKIHRRGEQVPQYIAVEDGKDSLFRDLLMISDNVIEQAKLESELRQRDYYELLHIPRTLDKQKLAIKELPWWKRLFNKF